MGVSAARLCFTDVRQVTFISRVITISAQIQSLPCLLQLFADPKFNCVFQEPAMVTPGVSLRPWNSWH